MGQLNLYITKIIYSLSPHGLRDIARPTVPIFLSAGMVNRATCLANFCYSVWLINTVLFSAYTSPCVSSIKESLCNIVSCLFPTRSTRESIMTAYA